MSPITMVRLPSRLNAAQLVRPIGGVIFTPAVVTDKSLRGTDTLNTPSFALNAPFTPVSSSMRAVSSLAPPFFWGAALALPKAATNPTIVTIRIIDSSPLTTCSSRAEHDGGLFSSLQTRIHFVPIDVYEERVNVLRRCRPIVHLVRMLIHVQDEQRLSERDRLRV